MTREPLMRRKAEQASGGGAWPLSRRRMLFASGGLMLLGMGASMKAADAGLPAAMLDVGRSRGTSRGRGDVAHASPDAASPRLASGERSAASAASGTSAHPAHPGRASADDGVETSPASPPIDMSDPWPPQPRLASEPKYYVDDAGPSAIALTFDDGPDPKYTPQVLDILDRYGIFATFNMIGEQIGDNLSLVREVAASGHTITNHTWDHADMRRYTLPRVLSEIDRCNEALADAGQLPTIFRAPYGYWTQNVFEACANRGLTPLGWSVDPQDWDDKRVTVQSIVSTVLRTTHRHDIILDHDGGGDRSKTVAALQIFIPALLERGFVFTAV